MKKVLWTFFLFLGLGLLIWHVDGYRQTQINSPSPIPISKKERRELEYLFKELVIYNGAGYTLLGHKPVTFDCFLQPAFKWDALFLWHAFLPSNLKKYKAWKTWQKYQDYFPQTNFVIWSEPSTRMENLHLIVVANKNQIHRVIHENPSDFESITIDLNKKNLFKDTLKSHDGLTGTILGYGRNNAWLFWQKSPIPCKGIFSDEMSQLFENKKAALNFSFGWPKVEMSEILMFPMFMADMESEETKKLRADYMETRKRILQYYEGKDFLDATLQLFTD